MITLLSGPTSFRGCFVYLLVLYRWHEIRYYSCKVGIRRLDSKQHRRVKNADCWYGICNFCVDFTKISCGFMLNLKI